LYGSDEVINYTIKTTGGITNKKSEQIEGVLEMIRRRHLETSSEMAREYYSKYMTEKECKVCHGQRLNEAALSVKINDKNIIDVTNMSISSAID
jgi:excinuclease ABC subunit A